MDLKTAKGLKYGDHVYSYDPLKKKPIQLKVNGAPKVWKTRQWSLLVLSINDRKQVKTMDIMHIQKVIRYFEYLRETQELSYSDFKYGTVSDELRQNLDTLVESGLLDDDEGKYCLTLEGKKAVQEVRKTFRNDQLKLLEFAKQQLNDLPIEELMYFLYKLIPSTQKNSIEYPRLERKRNQLICNLFHKGRINSTMAAQWLEISEKEFLDQKMFLSQ